MVRLDAVLDSWKTVREDTAQAVEDFAAHQLDFKPCPELMSFGDTARHILHAGHGLSGMLLDGTESLATPQFRESIDRHVAELPKTEDAAALARELRSEMERRSAELSAKSARILRRRNHAHGWEARHSPGNAAAHQRARADPPPAAFHVSSIEWCGAAHHPAASGESESVADRREILV